MALAAFTALMLLLLWLFQVVFLESFYKTIRVYDVKTSAAMVAANIDSADLDILMGNYARDNNVSIVVSDMQGNALHAASFGPDDIVRSLSARGIANLAAQAQANGGTYLMRFNARQFAPEDLNRGNFGDWIPQPGRGQMESIFFAKVVTNSGAQQLAVIISADISPVNATVSAIRVQLMIVTAIMLVLALLLALLISRRISRPIVKINASAKQLAKGNYDADFTSGGYREVAELGKTLGYAAGELAKTDNLRRELIANVSHDLRTPLTMITGYSEVMRDLPGENTQENVQIVIDEAKRLTSLVNDMLDLSKLQSGADTLKPAPFNLTAGIRTILARFAKLTGQEGYAIRFEDGSDVWVRADELKISQVVYNLMNNAIAFTGADKTVVVRQLVQGGKVRVEVADTGAGIPADKINDIWDRYYKAQSTGGSASPGSGIGLSIVKAILTLHGAPFGVQSSEGNGSVFWFELPVEPAGQ